MHEYSIVRALLRQVGREVRSRGGKSVRRVRVRIGELSGVEPDLLATAFTMSRASTVCNGAELEIERVPVHWRCPACARRIEVGEVLSCPSCARPAELAGGDEILLEQIEMEVA